jgi:hypothetical protein
VCHVIYGKEWAAHVLDVFLWHINRASRYQNFEAYTFLTEKERFPNLCLRPFGTLKNLNGIPTVTLTMKNCRNISIRNQLYWCIAPIESQIRRIKL